MTKARIPVTVAPDAEALAGYAAEWLVERITGSTGRFGLALSGGSTPRRLYQRLAAPGMRERVPWERVHLFWGDERFVPHDHPDSNYRMVREALLDHVAIPAANVHPMPTEEMTPEAAAAAYERTLQAYYGAAALAAGRPLFEVTLLGIGTDGHTASLFPGTAVLDERTRWAAAVIGAKPEPRLTLTYPALEASGDVVFLAAGEDKRQILANVLVGFKELPAARLRPTGSLRFFIDRAASLEQR